MYLWIDGGKPKGLFSNETSVEDYLKQNALTFQRVGKTFAVFIGIKDMTSLGVVEPVPVLF